MPFCRLLTGDNLSLAACVRQLCVGAATPLQKVVFVFAGFNERTGYIFVAKDLRFFEEQGLDVQIVQVRNGQVAVSALGGERGAVLFRIRDRREPRRHGRRARPRLHRGHRQQTRRRFRRGAEDRDARRSQRKVSRHSEHRRRRVDVHHACARSLGPGAGARQDSISSRRRSGGAHARS